MVFAGATPDGVCVGGVTDEAFAADGAFEQAGEGVAVVAVVEGGGAAALVFCEDGEVFVPGVEGFVFALYEEGVGVGGCAGDVAVGVVGGAGAPEEYFACVVGIEDGLFDEGV